MAVGTECNTVAGSVTWLFRGASTQSWWQGQVVRVLKRRRGKGGWQAIGGRQRASREAHEETLEAMFLSFPWSVSVLTGIVRLLFLLVPVACLHFPTFFILRTFGAAFSSFFSATLLPPTTAPASSPRTPSSLPTRLCFSFPDTLLLCHFRTRQSLLGTRSTRRTRVSYGVHTLGAADLTFVSLHFYFTLVTL